MHSDSYCRFSARPSIILDIPVSRKWLNLSLQNYIEDTMGMTSVYMLF